MDGFVFFLGMFTVLFFISLVLSYTNFFKFLKLKEDLVDTKRGFEDSVSGVLSSLSTSMHDIQDVVTDVELNLSDSMESSTRDVYAVIAKIENQLDAIIARLDQEHLENKKK